MKILVIMQFFQPEPVLRGLPLMQELKKLGNEIEVLTGFPNYPQGMIYPGYKQRLVKRECVDGVKIIRIPLYPSHDSNGMKRILNYLSYAISAIIMGPLVAGDFDIIYTYLPPLTVFVPSVLFKLLRRKPCIFDIQDLWPDTLASTGMIRNGKVLSIIGAFCKFSYRFSDKILVLSPGFKNALIDRGVPKEKISIVYNWSDDTAVHPVPKEACSDELGLNGYFIVMFAGNMGRAQALSSVIDAASLVVSRNNRIMFVFVGDGIEEEKLKRRSNELGLKNTVFLPRQPIEEIGKVMSLADVLLVHLRDDPLFSITIPSKVQTYLSIGKPILAAVKGDAADLIRASEAGIICEPQNPRSIADAVLSMANFSHERLDEMGKKGREYYVKNLSLHIGAKKIDAVLRDIHRESR